ncbi:MAG: sensor histidine kinase, partial [Chitinophagaceae bacterium]|nr:sensor histidine kinase [Chitinophagaceae bacterium]
EYNLYAYRELKKLNITTHRSKIASNLATVYYDNRQNDSALIWGRMAIDLGKEFSYINSEIMGNYIVGACMEKNNKLDSAVYFITEAIKLAKANDRIDLQASAQQVLGNVLLSKGHYQEALKNFQEALPIQQEMEDVSGYNQSQRGIGLAALGLKNYPLAATNLASYVQLHDSLLSSENRKIVSELNTKYETEKKEKLIAEKELLLLKKNAQIRQSILAGIILALGLIIFWVQYRRAQKAKLKKLAQEKEIAVLKAWMNGEERERNRISQELHDGVAAMLGAAKLNLQSIPHLPEEKKQVQYDKIATILDNTHSDVRRIAHNLLPITLQQEGLIAAIQQFARDLNVTGIIEVMVIDELQAELMLNKQTQLMLFRIIQELTNNIIKHAQASKATILFSNEEDTLCVKVSDNGKGFSAIADQDSQGLFSIRERLKSLGGVFDIDSKEGSGTSAVLHIALQKK